MESTMGLLSIIYIIVSVALFCLGIAVCFAILSIKNSLSDIADVYCKINKEKYLSLKEKEYQSKYEHPNI